MDLEHTREWQDVLDIQEAAQDCTLKDATEAAWIMDVCAPILRVALRGKWKEREVWYEDLTTARIFDKELLPKVAGVPEKSKMVDLGIVIKPRRWGPLSKRIVATGSTFPFQTVNQTDAPHVSQTPIAISAEVKRPDGSETVSWIQLVTWITAHYNHLQLLLTEGGSTSKPPALPLLQIRGHQWMLMIAERSEDNKIILHSGIELGSSGNLLGIYQIIASIRRLAQWILGDYRPWWTREILKFDEKQESEPQ